MFADWSCTIEHDVGKIAKSCLVEPVNTYFAFTFSIYIVLKRPRHRDIKFQLQGGNDF